MNDRELLELAAKAAGAKKTDYADNVLQCWIIQHTDGVWREWNPFAVDGDALRLAVKLELTVSFGVSLAGEPRCRAIRDADVGASEPAGADPVAATRRAIVRAAAEIGREMK